MRRRWLAVCVLVPCLARLPASAAPSGSFDDAGAAPWHVEFPLPHQPQDGPRFEDGRKVADARLTVRHNGVLIHEHVAVSRITPVGTQKQEAPTGPLHLQNHGNPVRYRNIWVVPKP